MYVIETNYKKEPFKKACTYCVGTCTYGAGICTYLGTHTYSVLKYDVGTRNYL